MQFNSVQDINAPLDYVFAKISDFEAYESYGMRFGATVERTDNLQRIQPGISWHVLGDFRGKSRSVDIMLQEFEAPRNLAFTSKSSGFEMIATMDLMALTKRQSRLKISLQAKPKSISARILLQSAKLARGSLNKRFNSRVHDFTSQIEDGYNRSARA